MKWRPLNLNPVLTSMAITLTDTGLLRLLQFSSATLPVGAYAFSQGLEQAVERGWVNTAAAAEVWLRDVLHGAIVSSDLAMLQRMSTAISAEDAAAFDYWNALLLASRESHELRLTDTATASALIKLLQGLNYQWPWLSAAGDADDTEHAYASIFALAGAQLQLDERAVQLAYAWAWLENQVAAATKLIPLGQTAAQTLLHSLAPELSVAVDAAAKLGDDELGGSLPALAMASAWHETQYSRLFRS